MDVKNIKKQAEKIVTIPGFGPGETETVTLRMPNLLKMAERGEIPNELLDVAASLAGITSKVKETNKPEERLKRVAKIMELYCRACMVDPTFEEVADYLTEEQMAYIFNWGRGDLRALEPFRKKQENGPGNNNGEGVPKEAK